MTVLTTSDARVRPIRVLVVDDSRVLQMLLVHLLESDEEMRVIGTVDDGHAALAFLERQKPDVILMDIHMPGIDGFETTRRIMETCPVPIVICSATSDPRSVATTFRLMEVGAVACVEKPVARDHKDFEAQAAKLVQAVKLMSEVKVVRRWSGARGTPLHGVAAMSPERGSGPHGVRIALVGMGASTGGPPVLQTIVSALPKDFGIPILIVQHIAPGFLSGLAEWLNDTTSLQVRIASHGELPLPGRVYLAPDEFQMGVGVDGVIHLSKDAAEGGLRPAVSFLFRSLAQRLGSRATGVLLTGMGTDGAAELKLMRDAGASTIAQDRASAVVNGMPGEAVRLDAAMQVLPAGRIAAALLALNERR